MDRFEKELRAIAESHVGIGLRLARGLAGMMYVEYGYVEGPTIEVAGPYPTKQACIMTVLHELGHAYEGHDQGRPPFEKHTHYFDQGVLHSEAQAWDWALDMAEEVFSLKRFEADTHRFMWDTCLGSYYRGAVAAQGKGGQRLVNGDRGYHEFTYDEPDDYFWQIAERLAKRRLHERGSP